MRLLQTLFPKGALPEARALAPGRGGETTPVKLDCLRLCRRRTRQCARPGAGRSQLSGRPVACKRKCQSHLAAGQAGLCGRAGRPLPAVLAGWRDDATVVAPGSAARLAAAFAIRR